MTEELRLTMAERNRKAAEWREDNKEDIARRIAGFRRAYGEIVEEWRIRITENGGSGPMLVDIYQDIGWVGYFEP